MIYILCYIFTQPYTHSPNVGLTLGHRLRRWPNVSPTFGWTYHVCWVEEWTNVRPTLGQRLVCSEYLKAKSFNLITGEGGALRVKVWSWLPPSPRADTSWGGGGGEGQVDVGVGPTGGYEVYIQPPCPPGVTLSHPRAAAAQIRHDQTQRYKHTLSPWRHMENFHNVWSPWRHTENFHKISSPWEHNESLDNVLLLW